MNIDKITETMNEVAEKIIDGREPMNPVILIHHDRVSLESDMHSTDDDCIAEIPMDAFVDYFIGDVTQFDKIENLIETDIRDGFNVSAWVEI